MVRIEYLCHRLGLWTTLYLVALVQSIALNQHKPTVQRGLQIMGRKKFDTKGKIRRKATREEDASWRLTHLLAASHVLSTDAPSISRFLVRTTNQIGRRINMTMDCITVKRQVCKKCHSLLIPNGPTPMRVRLSPRRETHVVVTCGKCGFLRRYLARSDTQKGSEKQESDKVEKVQPAKNDPPPVNEACMYGSTRFQKCGMQ